MKEEKEQLINAHMTRRMNLKLSIADGPDVKLLWSLSGDLIVWTENTTWGSLTKDFLIGSPGL
jgi:hypothetical protein